MDSLCNHRDSTKYLAHQHVLWRIVAVPRRRPPTGRTAHYALDTMGKVAQRWHRSRGRQPRQYWPDSVQ